MRERVERAGKEVLLLMIELILLHTISNELYNKSYEKRWLGVDKSANHYCKEAWEHDKWGRNINISSIQFLLTTQKKIYYSTVVFKIKVFMTYFVDAMNPFSKKKWWNVFKKRSNAITEGWSLAIPSDTCFWNALALQPATCTDFFPISMHASMYGSSNHFVMLRLQRFSKVASYIFGQKMRLACLNTKCNICIGNCYSWNTVNIGGNARETLQRTLGDSLAIWGNMIWYSLNDNCSNKQRVAFSKEKYWYYFHYQCLTLMTADILLAASSLFM